MGTYMDVVAPIGPQQIEPRLMNAVFGLQHRTQGPLIPAVKRDRGFMGGIELRNQLRAGEIDDAPGGRQGRERLFEIAADIGFELRLTLLRGSELGRRS